jgi:hypothetical protein
MREDLLLVSAKGLPVSKSTTSQPRFAQAVAIDVPFTPAPTTATRLATNLLSLKSFRKTVYIVWCCRFMMRFPTRLRPTITLAFRGGFLGLSACKFSYQKVLVIRQGLLTIFLA